MTSLSLPVFSIKWNLRTCPVLFGLHTCSILCSWESEQGPVMAREVRLSKLSCDPSLHLFHGNMSHFLFKLVWRCGSLWLTGRDRWQDGWPLGLGALNARAGAPRGVALSGSASFSTTAFTSSHSTSSLPSTDFDTEVNFVSHNCRALNISTRNEILR